MARLKYLNEFHTRILVEAMTRGLFPDTPAFQLNGEAGRGRLLGALDAPRWPQHRTLQTKAGVLHYHLNTDHPYVDGNKRLALTAMDTFLLVNGASLMASPDEVRDLALGVADGSISRSACIAFVRRRTLRFRWDRAQIRSWLQRMPPDELPMIAEASDVLRARGEQVATAVGAVLRAARKEGFPTPI